jgi:hypothetical protein
MCNVVGGLAAERASENGVMLACSRHSIDSPS